MEFDSEFDFIVSGAGSAGCAVAGRLAESGRFRVLLLEAGPSDSAFWIKVPMGYPMLFTNPKVNWMFESEPEPELNGRPMYNPRGKVLGGTSSINGMLYVRGHPNDYDTWAQMGNTGWGWDDVLPFFRKAEDQTRGADAYHGTGGPLTVSDQPNPSPVALAIIEAAVQAGVPRNADFNGARQEGTGLFQTTTRKRRRWNSARAYLSRSRANLRVDTNAHATRLLLEDKRVIGIEYRQQGRILRARARHGVVVSGGSFGSPQLLQLSGIGPAEHLRDMGLPVLHDLPGVGANLRDHFYASMIFRCHEPVTINELARSPLRQFIAGAQYVLAKRGPLAANGIFAGVFTRTNETKSRPNLQINTNIWSVASRDKKGMKVHDFPGFTMSPVHLDPVSTGEVRLRSADPYADPVIRHNFFRDEVDRQAMVDAVRIVRRIANQPALGRYMAEEIRPGGEVNTDAEIVDWVRANGIANLHPVGSCAMLPGVMGVVDHRLRVHGIEGLRVADASIMPGLPAGNTNAPSIMIGEKCAAMILEDMATASTAMSANKDRGTEWSGTTITT